MTLLRNKTIKYFYLFLVILLFIIGFLSRENIAGAAETDFLKFIGLLFYLLKETLFIQLLIMVNLERAVHHFFIF